MLHTRSLSIWLTAGLLSAAVTSCGGSGSTNSASHSPSNPPATASATANTASSTASASPPAKPAGGWTVAGLRRDRGASGLDVPALPEDRPRYGFYGHPASPSDRHAITTLIKRYYALAAADNAKSACAMLVPGLAKSLPVDYGQLGESYLHGAKTCEAVLSRMFEHSRRELSVPITVNGVFVNGEQAYASLGSTRMPLSIIILTHEHGKWIIAKPLGSRIQEEFLPHKRPGAK